MKKIGILFGRERSFPPALIQRINDKNVDGIMAEPVKIDKVAQGLNPGYAVIVDRISQDVPFYRAMLKNAAATGTAVINNPFWWSADEKFFNNVLSVGDAQVPVPKTVLLPSFELPDDTTGESFSNLASPMDWDSMFDYIGWPAWIKPHDGGGWKSVYKVNNKEELWKAQSETGQLVMMMQEDIKFDAYFRCYCIGRKYVKIMHYEPRNEFMERYKCHHDVSDEMLKTIHDYVIKLNEWLGYDFNTVEFAIRDGVPLAIDFCNPAPDADLFSVGEENFEWVIENAANYCIERAQAHEEGKNNLTWGEFIKNSVK